MKDKLSAIALALKAIDTRANISLGIGDEGVDLLSKLPGTAIYKNIYPSSWTVIESIDAVIEGVCFHAQRDSRPMTEEEKKAYVTKEELRRQIDELNQRMEALDH